MESYGIQVILAIKFHQIQWKNHWAHEILAIKSYQIQWNSMMI